MVYRVYQAELTELDGTSTGETFIFCCSNVREVSLRKEIEEGQKLIYPSSLTLLQECENRQQALDLTNWCEM